MNDLIFLKLPLKGIGLYLATLSFDGDVWATARALQQYSRGDVLALSSDATSFVRAVVDWGVNVDGVTRHITANSVASGCYLLPADTPDHVLKSFVRQRAIKHVRDIRRLREINQRRLAVEAVVPPKSRSALHHG